VGLGRQRIGYIGPTLDYLYGAERLAGYQTAMASAGRVVDDHLVRLDEPTPEGGHRAALAVLRDRPDAVHVATDPMAVGVLRALSERGLRVPDDVAIVGFDGLPGARPTDPVLTTVVQPVVEVGRRAVHLLCDEIDDQGADQGPVVILPTELRIGGTCGSRPTT
jgi:LacI family transcriptional regulator